MLLEMATQLLHQFNWTFDGTAPTGAITYSPAPPYKQFDSVTITATFTETLTTTPKIAISGVSTINATDMTGSGMSRHMVILLQQVMEQKLLLFQQEQMRLEMKLLLHLQVAEHLRWITQPQLTFKSVPLQQLVEQ